MAYLDREYLNFKHDIDQSIQQIIHSTSFIGGPSVHDFEERLFNFLEVDHVISCANGTDALLAAFLALELEEGDEVIMPAFGYISAYEMCCLLKLQPILVDVDLHSYNIDATQIESAISNRTKVVLVQHLYGLPCAMEKILAIAQKHNLYIVEDAAQAIGAKTVIDGKQKFAGTIGHIGTFSFYPTKNLGCYGDGGALCTNDNELAHRMRQMVTHGQDGKYNHVRLGINSRLDALQAGILNVKILHLSILNKNRNEIALRYYESLSGLNHISLPYINKSSEHVYHQFTIRCLNNTRESLKTHLSENGIDSTVYYPKPIHQQLAYQGRMNIPYPISEKLAKEVLSIPIHPLMIEEEIDSVIDQIKTWDNDR